MMYREFIDLTSFGESYITYKMYTQFIEPVYNESSLDKRAFCKRFYNLHNDCVNSLVEASILSLSLETLEEYITTDSIPADLNTVKEFHNKLLVLFLKAVWIGKFNSRLSSKFNYRKTGVRLSDVSVNFSVK